METKSILSSKVFWFNAVAFVASAATGIEDIIDPKILQMIIAIINIILRYFTNKKIVILEG